MTAAKRNLIETAGKLQAALDAAPNSRVGSQWWNDRANELALVWRQIERM